MIIGIALVVVLFVLLAAGTWIGPTLGIVGMVALFNQIGLSRTMNLIGTEAWGDAGDFLLVAIPLFVLMGEILGSFSDRLYLGVTKIVTGLPGGLLQTNIVVCSMLAALTGSSVVTAATVGSIAYPEMSQKRSYGIGLTLGSLAAGGTLGILIPPSIPMVVYASITDQSLGRLLIASFIPGFGLALLFMLYIAARVLLNPSLAHPEPRVSLRARLSGCKAVAPTGVVVIVIFWMLYGGVATPTEVAGIGAGLAMLLSIFYRRMSLELIKKSTLSAVKISSICLLLIIGAKVMGKALAYYGVPPLIGQWGAGIGSPLLLLVGLVVLYLILGCFFDSFSMMLLTLPFLVPMMVNAGIDLIWFGPVMMILLEAGLITPPVGINLYIIQGVTKRPLEEVAWGSLPFVVIMVVMVGILYAFPDIVLWLPRQMY